MKEKIMFSVVIPCYNAEKYISEALDSIIKQSCKNYEVVIINDGSKDNSLEVINQYKNKIQNLRIISKENGGIIEARRDGISNAKGEYIIFLDADDLLDEKCLEIFEKNISKAHPDIIRGNYCSFTEDGQKHSKLEFDNCFLELDNAKVFSDFMVEFLNNSKYNCVWRQAIKRSIIKVNDIPKKINMGDDIAINFMNYCHAHNIMFISDILYYYRINSSSICNKVNEDTLIRNLNDMSSLYSFIADYTLTIDRECDKDRIRREAYKAYILYFNLYFTKLYCNIKSKRKIRKYCKEYMNSEFMRISRCNVCMKDFEANEHQRLIKAVLDNNRFMYLLLFRLKRY